MKVGLAAHTEVDLLRGIEWFDRISIDLGEMFEAEFYRALERVKANPELFAADHSSEASMIQTIHRLLIKVSRPLTTFVVLLLAFSSLGSHAKGQVTSSIEPADSIIRLHADVTYYFCTDRYSAGRESVDQLYRREFRDNISLPIDRIRFLAVDQVRKELKLSETTNGKLVPVLELLERYEQRDRWDYFVRVDEVSEMAKRNVAEFIESLKQIDEDHLLSADELIRLDQIRLRFNCMGIDQMQMMRTPAMEAMEKLKLNEKQTKRIQEIIKQELEKLLQVGNQVDEVLATLSSDQQAKTKKLFEPYLKLIIPPALSFAQCQDLLRLEGDEQYESEDFDKYQINSPIFTMQGQMAPECFVEWGENQSVPLYWSEFISLAESSGLDWLGLSNDQLSELIDLKKIVSRQLPDGTETSVALYHGYRLLSDEERPKQNWSKKEFSDFRQWYLKKMKTSEETLGDKVKSILLPNQLDNFKLAIALRRTMELGPFHVIESDSVSEYLSLDSEQKAKIKSLRESRLKKLQTSNSSIEHRVFAELTADQKTWFQSNFGEYTDLYPSVWFFLL